MNVIYKVYIIRKTIVVTSVLTSGQSEVIDEGIALIGMSDYFPVFST